MSYTDHWRKRNTITPQSEVILGREADMTQNRAGGFSFLVDCWTRLDRFLILGSDKNTFYASARELTRSNAVAVEECLKIDAARTVARIAEVSDLALAPKVEPALFALAIAASSENVQTRKLALRDLPKVCRIPTHLFKWLEMLKALRGWSRGLRTAVANWYLDRDPGELEHAMIKYQSREGWRHRDVLRMAHPRPDKDDARRRALFDWACDRPGDVVKLPMVSRMLFLHASPSVPAALDAISNGNLPREALPTELLNSPEVWRLLQETMPPKALLRNLGKMSSVGVLGDASLATQKVCQRLTDVTAIRKARLHPVDFLIALRQYGKGRGDKGKLEWHPSQMIMAALEEAFKVSFHAIEPTNKRILLALDVSGSMSGGDAGAGLTPREAASVIALTIANIEPVHHFVGFTADGGSSWRGSGTPACTPLMIHKGESLDAVTRYTASLPFGGTDCALPFLYAKERRMDFDAVITITDNETWAGSVHPMEALRDYRKHTGINTKFIAMAMTATEYSIADAADSGCLNVVGFDASVPKLIQEFLLS
jgi:60 kDa SS-A/Ro ribonucleoprotein